MKRLCFLLLFCSASLSKTTAQTATQDTSVLIVAEKMPEYDGNLVEFMNRHIVYPAKARDKGITGKVVASFIIRKDGSIDTIEIIQSPDENLSNEVVRFVKRMPKWKPGLQKGIPVDVRVTFPVVFKLDEK